MIRTLEGVSWEQLAAAFTLGFSDYAVPMVMSAAALEAMQRRRGYDPRVSFGAYAGDELVGFALTCRDGERIYNSGTGVAPAHRRGGMARALIQAVLAATGSRDYVLEVLEDNAKAIAFYASLGFVETRRLQCWTYAGVGGEALPEVVLPDALDLAIEPAWQNSRASIARADAVVLGDEHGVVVVCPSNGDVPLLAVRQRRRGHGRRLLAGAAAYAGKPLRILNLDERATGIAAFLEAVGAVRFVRQLEMIRVA